ncbi:MAG: phenylalanyl-tRNA synthetase beta chain [Acidimicrobiales bacterium]|jgi:phenylalanyl-tRNA synthetase beta chain
MLVVHNWLKDYIGDSIPSAQEIEKLLTFHSFEIEGIETVAGHEVIDVDVLPNRSSDCLCHRGIAREIATITGVPLVNDPLQKEITPQETDVITVDIEDEKACPRFTASLMTGIEVKDSPRWLQDRLQALGQRPINNIVDATNYVMYAIGQPIHAYDADKFPQVDGKWQFAVRYAKEGEVVSLIAEGGKDEDRDVVLKGTELLIIDKSSNTPIGLAGVKGGRFAGVDENTTKIIIECAHFDATLTRKTARRLGIVIDASKRFENECSRELPLCAQQEVTALIADIAGGAGQGVLDVYLEKKENTKVSVRPEKVNALLGLSLSEDEMESILTRMGATVEKAGDHFECVGPWERTDLSIEEDFTEEIGRVYGLDKIESVVPETVALTELNARHSYSEQVRDVLVGLGFSEVIISSFRKKDKIRLQNALASDKEYMRSNLAKGIVDVLDKNAGFTDLLGIEDIRVFEIGTVFHKTEGGIAEHVSLALGVRTKASGYNPKDEAVLEEVLGVIESKLNTTVNRSIEKGVFECNFTEVFESLPAPAAYETVSVAEEIAYKPFSLYPAMTRDIAMWVPEGTSKEDVEKVLNESAGDLRIRTTHVDEFSKEGRTSLAFRLVFQAMDRTLTDDEVNTEMDKVYKAATEQDWETR